MAVPPGAELLVARVQPQEPAPPAEPPGAVAGPGQHRSGRRRVGPRRRRRCGGQGQRSPDEADAVQPVVGRASQPVVTSSSRKVGISVHGALPRRTASSRCPPGQTSSSGQRSASVQAGSSRSPIRRRTGEAPPDQHAERSMRTRASQRTAAPKRQPVPGAANQRVSHRSSRRGRCWDGAGPRRGGDEEADGQVAVRGAADDGRRHAGVTCQVRRPPQQLRRRPPVGGSDRRGDHDDGDGAGSAAPARASRAGRRGHAPRRPPGWRARRPRSRWPRPRGVASGARPAADAAGSPAIGRVPVVIVRTARPSRSGALTSEGSMSPAAGSPRCCRRRRTSARPRCGSPRAPPCRPSRPERERAVDRVEGEHPVVGVGGRKVGTSSQRDGVPRAEAGAGSPTSRVTARGEREAGRAGRSNAPRPAFEGVGDLAAPGPGGEADPVQDDLLEPHRDGNSPDTSRARSQRAAYRPRQGRSPGGRSSGAGTRKATTPRGSRPGCRRAPRQAPPARRVIASQRSSGGAHRGAEAEADAVARPGAGVSSTATASVPSGATAGVDPPPQLGRRSARRPKGAAREVGGGRARSSRRSTRPAHDRARQAVHAWGVSRPGPSVPMESGTPRLPGLPPAPGPVRPPSTPPGRAGGPRDGAEPTSVQVVQGEPARHAVKPAAATAAMVA